MKLMHIILSGGKKIIWEDTQMAVYLDEDECIGCGTCEELCPEVFKLNTDTEKAEVIKPAGGPADLIEEAIDNCPASCIYEED